MILDKAKMAHEWVMKYGKVDSNYNRENTVQLAWDYADAMQAEADKRAVKLPDVFFDTKPNKEWQPDWSQAPDNMTHFAVDANGSGWFFNREPHAESDCCWYCGDGSIELDNHNYQGNWQDSLRKRP